MASLDMDNPRDENEALAIGIIESATKEVTRLKSEVKRLQGELDAWRNCFICIECGRGAADEDGCCTTCGRDAVCISDGKLFGTLHEHFDGIEKEHARIRLVLKAAVALAHVEFGQDNGHEVVALQNAVSDMEEERKWVTHE